MFVISKLVHNQAILWCWLAEFCLITLFLTRLDSWHLAWYHMGKTSHRNFFLGSLYLFLTFTHSLNGFRCVFFCVKVPFILVVWMTGHDWFFFKKEASNCCVWFLEAMGSYFFLYCKLMFIIHDGRKMILRKKLAHDGKF